MRRRALLSTLAVLSGALAGCGATGSNPDPDEPGATTPDGTTGDTPTTRDGSTTTRDGSTTADDSTTTHDDHTTIRRPAERHDVRVEMIRRSGLTGREFRFVVGADGWLTVQVTCGEGTATPATRERRLDPAVHDELVAAVLAADRDAWDQKYECTGECPMDVPGRRYVLTVDGTETEVFVDVQAEGVPKDLVRVQQLVHDIRTSVDVPSCGTVEPSLRTDRR